MSESRVIAIVQARMGSSRLPGKILCDIDGETMLGRIVRRLQRARSLDAVVIATTCVPGDDATEGECTRLGVPSFRGSEHDVLDRFFRASAEHRASVAVRVTADCPLVDPQVVDWVVNEFSAADVDYASNVLQRTFPRGLDVEVISYSALERAWREDDDPSSREHVTPCIYRHPDRFRLHGVVNAEDHSGYRWTVDTPEDLAFVRKIYTHLGHDEFSWQDVLALLRQRPEWAEINRHVQQKVVAYREPSP
jgi:spore coat polysaccharide biosynthesis protein SpsF